jgi:hypothetical protein
MEKKIVKREIPVELIELMKKDYSNETLHRLGRLVQNVCTSCVDKAIESEGNPVCLIYAKERWHWSRLASADGSECPLVEELIFDGTHLHAIKERMQNLKRLYAKQRTT